MKNLKFKIYTLGCKVNQYDSGRLAAELKLAGWEVAEGAADLAIINSCAVTETAMVKSRRMIKLARKENPGAKIILIGCWTRTGGDKVAGADVVLKTADAKKIVREIASSPDYIGVLAMTDKADSLAMTDRSRYFIKIQDGCEQYCSYCVVPYTRGKLASRPEAEAIAEIKQAVRAGYREIVLSGIHLGMYGKEVRSCLINLIKKLIKIPKLGRIRLSSIEITEVTDELIKLMMKSKKICRHLHIPVQSGSDKILKLMNRPYDTEYFINKVKQIRRAMPDIALTTDVITGFPGETEEDYKETVKFIKRMEFSRLHVFPFSAHAQTPAAKLPNQHKEKEKQRRAEILRRLGARLEEDYGKKFKGRQLDVVVERSRRGWLTGKTEYYFDFKFKGDKKNLIGKIVKAKI